jgi:hypothetical protein
LKRVALCAILFARVALADDTGPNFARGTQALQQGTPNEAIGAFEALADHGVADASISFNRGLSYAARVRIGAGQPGDLGRAIHGFEEARTLSHDEGLVHAAESALLVLRGEVAARQLTRGASLDVDRPQPLTRILSSALPLRAWNTICISASILFALALLGRPRLNERGRLAAAIAASLLVPSWGYTLAMSHLAERTAARSEAVVVIDNLRLGSDRGLIPGGAEPLPEGARVEVLSTLDGWSRVEWGRSKGYVPIGAIRIIATGQ